MYTAPSHSLCVSTVQNDNTISYSDAGSRFVARIVTANDEPLSMCLVLDGRETVNSSLPVARPFVSSAFVELERATVESASKMLKRGRAAFDLVS